MRRPLETEHTIQKRTVDGAQQNIESVIPARSRMHNGFGRPPACDGQKYAVNKNTSNGTSSSVWPANRKGAGGSQPSIGRRPATTRRQFQTMKRQLQGDAAALKQCRGRLSLANTSGDNPRTEPRIGQRFLVLGETLPPRSGLDRRQVAVYPLAFQPVVGLDGTLEETFSEIWPPSTVRSIRTRAGLRAHYTIMPITTL